MAEVGECTVGDLPDYCGGGVPTGLCMVEGLLARAANPTRDILLHPYAQIAGLVMILQFHLMPVVAYACEKKALVRARARVTQGSSLIGTSSLLVDAWELIAPYAKNPIRAIFGRSRRSNFARCLGRNIIILNIYYGKGFAEAEQAVLRSVKHHPALVVSVVFAFFESVIVYKIASELQKRLMVSEEANHDYNKASEEAKETIDNKFADFSVPWSMATFIFVGQSALFLFFVLELNGDRKLREACNMNVFHWLTAVIVTNIAGLGESGEGFHMTVWDELWKRSAKIYSANTEIRRKYDVKKYSAQYWCRLFYAMAINGFIREALLCLAPVALSVVDRGDLVKDCLAIFFISQMDDLKEPKKIDDSLEEWKKEVLADDGDDPEEEERESMEPKEADARSTLLQQPRTPRAGVDVQRSSNLSPRSPRRGDPEQGLHIPKSGVHAMRDTSSSPRPPPSSPRFLKP